MVYQVRKDRIATSFHIIGYFDRATTKVWKHKLHITIRRKTLTLLSIVRES